MRARARVRPLAPELPLDVEQARQQRASVERGLPYDHTVQECRLLTDADRRRFVKRGHAKVGDETSERIDRVAQVALPVTQIAPQRDRHRMLDERIVHTSMFSLLGSCSGSGFWFEAANTEPG